MARPGIPSLGLLHGNPVFHSIGVRYVIVNGRAVVSEGRITDERPGRPLRGPGYNPRLASAR